MWYFIYMIIFTSGAPHAGKTELLKMILPQLSKEAILIDPKAYLPGNYEDLSDQDRTDFNVAAWEACLEVLDEMIRKDSENVIVFDSAASKSQYMIPYFFKAKQHNHEVAYLFIEAEKEILKEHAGDKYLGDLIIDRYIDNLKSSSQVLKTAATLAFSVKNNKSIESLKLQADQIAIALNKRI